MCKEKSCVIDDVKNRLRDTKRHLFDVSTLQSTEWVQKNFSDGFQKKRKNSKFFENNFMFFKNIFT